jgi:hypothetical protein
MQLEELSLDLFAVALTGWLGWATALPTLRTFHQEWGIVRATFARDETQRFSRLHVIVPNRRRDQTAYAPVQTLLGLLPSTALTSLTVEMNRSVEVTPAETDAFEAAARAQTQLVELVLPRRE